MNMFVSTRPIEREVEWLDRPGRTQNGDGIGRREKQRHYTGLTHGGGTHGRVSMPGKISTR